MKPFTLLIILIFFVLPSNAQSKNQISLQGHFGPQGNFFVRSYDEAGGPPGNTYFYKKNFIGTVAGLDVRYRIGAKSQIGLAFSRSTNKGVINYDGTFNGVDILIEDFAIRHLSDFYQLFYERSLKKSGNLFYHAGLVIVNTHQQEIDLEGFENLILFQERNYKNSGLQEGGVFVGIRYDFPIDKHFNLGCQARVYYLISTGTFDAVSLTPTLSYRFDKKQ